MRASPPEALIVSDTHGDVAVLAALFAWARRRRIGAVFALGDGAADYLPAMDRSGFNPPLRLVRGNGDWGADLPAQLAVDFAGRRFFLCHGHLHGVDRGLDFLASSAAAEGCGAALFGHTHRPFWEEIGGLLLLNPGSPSRPRSRAGPSFATVACPADGWFDVRHWSVGRSQLGRWRFRPIDLPSALA
jgi:putative phosphoesterase